MSIGNLFLVVNSLTVLYLICYNSLSQNTTDVVTKCHSYFTTKCDISLLQNASVFLLQNATVLLQNATVITNYENFITKCDVYYKLRQYNTTGFEQNNICELRIRQVFNAPYLKSSLSLTLSILFSQYNTFHKGIQNQTLCHLKSIRY